MSDVLRSGLEGTVRCIASAAFEGQEIRAARIRRQAGRAYPSSMAEGEGSGDRLRVFVSYTHDDAAHRQRVLDLVQALRAGYDIDADLDQFHEQDPPASWPLWMYRQIADADRVIVVCTEPYKRRAEGEEKPGKGLGVAWEAQIITHELYAKRTNRFVPVVLDPADVDQIPYFLVGTTRYLVGGPDDPLTIGPLDDLVDRLRGIPKVVPAALGPETPDPLAGFVLNEHPQARIARALKLESQGTYEGAAAEFEAIANEVPDAANALRIAAARNHYLAGGFEVAIEMLVGERNGPQAAQATDLLRHVQGQADAVAEATMAELRIRLTPGSDDWANLRYELHQLGTDAVLGQVLAPDSMIDVPAPLSDFVVGEVSSQWLPRVVAARAVRRDLARVVVEVDAQVEGTGVMAAADAYPAAEAGEVEISGEVNEHYVEVFWTGAATLSFTFDRRLTEELGGLSFLT